MIVVLTGSLMILNTACSGRAATPTAAPTAGPVPSAAVSAPPTASPSAGTGPSGPPFTGTVTAATAADVPKSWRAGCPVGPDRLAVLRLSYWDFDGRPRVGTLIAHRDVAAGLVTVFETLYRERFPIRRLDPVDAFDGSDDASMAADNTSAFNCRRAVAAGAPTWSEHAYGRAIDVNPVENPYLFDRRVLPPAGSDYVDRANRRPGMAVPGGILVTAFAKAGWSWGGEGRSHPDYQHFSTSGK
ncbi:M15 family metallopeptidase [Virgisporangium ochraceum]|uniref:M15 family metallopeptidase n=1 Tax=Virgisporangium ochraceum TaxID=65505 RepID=UPI0019420366|nr:M15 family metallopeptidase [Virgisporangium ochraceum]